MGIKAIIYGKETECDGYAIAYHSQMTDEDVYFISTNQQALIEKEKLFTEFLTTEDDERFYEIDREFDKSGIVVREIEDLCDSVYIIIKRHSFRY